jgi:hypothetical protein
MLASFYETFPSVMPGRGKNFKGCGDAVLSPDDPFTKTEIGFAKGVSKT